MENLQANLTLIQQHLAAASDGKYPVPKLIAVTNEPRLQLADLRAAINAKGLSNLCAPRALIVVPGIPKLGTGKTNHRELEKLIAA